MNERLIGDIARAAGEKIVRKLDLERHAWELISRIIEAAIRLAFGAHGRLAKRLNPLGK